MINSSLPSLQGSCWPSSGTNLCLSVTAGLHSLRPAAKHDLPPLRGSFQKYTKTALTINKNSPDLYRSGDTVSFEVSSGLEPL